MQRTIYYCDHCGKEITRERYRINIKLEKQDPEFENFYDICPECKIRLREWITKKPMKQDRPKAADASKVIMLWDMGWDTKKIADELGTTPNQVKDIIRRLPFLERRSQKEEKNEEYDLPEDDLTND